MSYPHENICSSVESDSINCLVYIRGPSLLEICPACARDLWVKVEVVKLVLPDSYSVVRAGSVWQRLIRVQLYCIPASKYGTLDTPAP